MINHKTLFSKLSTVLLSFCLLSPTPLLGDDSLKLLDQETAAMVKQKLGIGSQDRPLITQGLWDLPQHLAQLSTIKYAGKSVSEYLQIQSNNKDGTTFPLKMLYQVFGPDMAALNITQGDYHNDCHGDHKENKSPDPTSRDLVMRVTFKDKSILLLKLRHFDSMPGLPLKEIEYIYNHYVNFEQKTRSQQVVRDKRSNEIQMKELSGTECNYAVVKDLASFFKEIGDIRVFAGSGAPNQIRLSLLASTLEPHILHDSTLNSDRRSSTRRKKTLERAVKPSSPTDTSPHSSAVAQ